MPPHPPSLAVVAGKCSSRKGMWLCLQILFCAVRNENHEMIHRRSDAAKYLTLRKHEKHNFTPMGTGFVWDCTSRIQQNVSSQSKDGHCSERYSLHAAKSFSIRWQFLRQSKKYPHSFTNVEGSWPIWQEPATGPHLEPHKSSLRPLSLRS